MQRTMKILETSIFDVFEKMFFVYLEPCGAASVPGDPYMKATIAFDGPMNGEINAYFSKPFLSLMAQNMLSVNRGEVTDEMREDCAREAVNMICGHFLSLVDPGRQYELTVPECGPAADTASEDERLDYAADMMPWAVAVSLSGSVKNFEGAS